MGTIAPNNRGAAADLCVVCGLPGGCLCSFPARNGWRTGGEIRFDPGDSSAATPLASLPFGLPFSACR